MPANFSALNQLPGSLRVASLLLSLLALIFVLVALAIHSTDDFVGYESAFFDFLSLATLCYTILWSFSAICVLVFHGPYPPGVDIALDFCGCGLAWAFGILIIQWSAYIDYPSDCGDSYNSAGFCTRARTLMAMEILAALLTFVYGALHLKFFFTAIRTLMNERQSRRNKPVDSELQDGEHLTGEA